MIPMHSVKITVLADDFNGFVPGYVKSFGFAALIEKGDIKVLFDTGTKQDVLIHNLNQYGVSPKLINAIILSHNHYDHTNGLLGIIKEHKSIPIYVHHYWDTPARHSGNDISQLNVIINDKARECVDIAKGVYLTNTHVSRDYGGIYEHACYIQVNDSYILLCGCCHPGLNKFLSDRPDLNIPLEASLHFIGGMHSFKFTDKEAENLKSNTKSITLCHCTQYFKTYQEQFQEKCYTAVLGKPILYYD
jgi:7,8-dihydropterin-6-yl-methyl-4-(beta-D-ribofuranosyl)aminobenzene 5'-phosphate synthase